ncbi:porin PorA family protein, partial [Nocardia sp. NPDC002869]|uniref:porin PorA family protein n=1 Tax=Nocardia sp. NPDC002869 TaxID=3161032 RepID=UPI00398D3431
ALKATMVFDTDTVESQLAVAKDNIDKLSLFGRVLPIVFGILGVLALIAGIALGLTGGRGGQPARPTGPARRPTGGTSTAASADAPTTTLPRTGNADAPTETIKLPKNL